MREEESYVLSSPIAEVLLSLGHKRSPCARAFHLLARHYNDVQWALWRLKSPTSWLFTQPFVQAQITKKNIKAPRHLPLWGEFTCDRWIPCTKASDAEKGFHLMTSSCDSRVNCEGIWQLLLRTLIHQQCLLVLWKMLVRNINLKRWTTG